MRIRIFIFSLLFAFPLFGQQTVKVKKGQNIFISWDEVMTDTSGKTLTRTEVFYQVYFAPFSGSSVDWNNKISVFSDPWKPADWNLGTVEVDHIVTLDKKNYQVVVTAIIFDSSGAIKESENSDELIILIVTEGMAPPVAPGMVAVGVGIN